MTAQPRKLGILVSAPPGHRNHTHALRLAMTAIASGVDVYFYCLDDAVMSLEDSRLQELRSRGLKLFACAYSALVRDLPLTDHATFCGLSVLSDLICHTDRFVSFQR